MDWIVPCILFYVQKGVPFSQSKGTLGAIDPSVLMMERPPQNIPRSPVQFTPIQFHELPQKGALVAIDAEFVTLNQEEAEVKTDGTQSTIKPSRLSVARISCVRG